MEKIKIMMLTGSLEWDIGEQVSHRAGDILSINFTITNPTADARSYQIFMALFDPATGSVITGTTGPITIGNTNVFEVAGGSELSLEAAFKIDYSNAVIQAALYDIQTGEMAVGLQSVLVEPPENGLPAADDMGMTGITGFVAGIMLLGMVAGMMTNLADGMR